MICVSEVGIGVVDGTQCDPMPISSHWITNPAIEFDVGSAQFILVVEKEGIFSRLVEDKFWRRLPCVVITGKGFPDLATRAMVHQVSTRTQLPVYGLADCNPFGLALLLTYKLGSARMGSKYCCDLRWLGLRPSQVPALNLPAGAIQELSVRDLSRLDSLEKLLESTEASSEGDVLSGYCREMELMRSTGKKYELEALICGSHDLSVISKLSEFLEIKIAQQCFI
jgi:meiotic recombination protein SPO11